MINPFKEINWKPDEAAISAYGRTMLMGFAIIAGLLFLVGIFRNPFDEAVATPLVVFLAGFFIYALSRLGADVCKPVYLVWHFLAACLGIVVANLMLFLFFYLVFAPFALLARWTTGRDPLALKKDPERKTYWIDAKPQRDLKSYFKLY
ncbi:MAG: hypothetical protein GXP32_08185 [Kiritimatiellaeota bacterium]|nr:hypothetical protein [Kiritimatiellota bacterium]